MSNSQSAPQVFEINSYDLVAAETLEQAIHFYKNKSGLYYEREINRGIKVINLEQTYVTIERRYPDEKDYEKYAELQAEFLDDEDDTNVSVPADALLALEWSGKPYLFASDEG